MTQIAQSIFISKTVGNRFCSFYRILEKAFAQQWEFQADRVAFKILGVMCVAIL